MKESTNRGIIDSGSRVMDELLRKTAFKDSLRHLLQNIDPQSAPQLVRVLMGRDIEVPFSILCSLPAVANSLILMVDELIRQIREMFPDPLLNDFMESLLNEIDYQALARILEGTKKLSEAMSPAFQGALTKLTAEGASQTGEVQAGITEIPAALPPQGIEGRNPEAAVQAEE
ncbi:MAG TPA: hypothetical protein PKM41_04065 [Deltaproteobacteria bacterium]|jgi:hypothetical protein|nr:hypothetical protein [Deltaproteobacteria bacterium]HOI06090.1 hypothetical protein [Deltaproteobacteria bacterium]